MNAMRFNKLKLLCSCLVTIAIASAVQAQEPQLPDLNLQELNYAPADRTVPLSGIDTGTLFLEARLSEEAAPVDQGMVWRIFGTKPTDDGKLPLIAVAKGGGARIDLEPGSYLVHAAFGRAGATSRITIQKETRRESLVLNAGGLRLNAVLPDGSSMRESKLTFDIYERRPNQAEDTLILPNVPAGKTIRLNAGTYHVVSKYGAVNAVTRADLMVEAGKTTEASVEHRAAQVTLNLVLTSNGFPLADTAWSVLTLSGDIIKEDVGAVPTMILSAGEYTIIAKNKDRIYQRDIEVIAGRDLTIRVEAIDENEVTVQ
ncbi:MAG: hypothetical protein AAGF25_02820 [Pseudomonadota bacterium]